jgi:WD40-like Beta Propeller Repeat
VAVLVGAVSWTALRADVAPISPQVTRFAITEPSLGGFGVAVSHDGSQVAYVSARGLVVRSLNRLDSTVAAATNNVQSSPFFSPDGQWLGFKGWDLPCGHLARQRNHFWRDARTVPGAGGWRQAG